MTGDSEALIDIFDKSNTHSTASLGITAARQVYCLLLENLPQQ